jgi:hypothetical protein
MKQDYASFETDWKIRLPNDIEGWYLHAKRYACWNSDTSRRGGEDDSLRKPLARTVAEAEDNARCSRKSWSEKTVCTTIEESQVTFDKNIVDSGKLERSSTTAPISYKINDQLRRPRWVRCTVETGMWKPLVLVWQEIYWPIALDTAMWIKWSESRMCLRWPRLLYYERSHGHWESFGLTDISYFPLPFWQRFLLALWSPVCNEGNKALYTLRSTARMHQLLNLHDLDSFRIFWIATREL